MYSYKTSGVCSQQIVFDIENGIVKKVNFYGGCNGNLQAISKLVEGMKAEDAVEKLRGINCGGRTTSCADQLAIALEAGLKQQAV